MKELDVLAIPENLPKVLSFVKESLSETDCLDSAIYHIEIAVEEIFVNIASYAYNPETGPATIRVETTKEPVMVSMSFIDHGKPYDPLAKPDPNFMLPLKERKRGGLGIFMTKKFMDEISYEYRDGQNILTLKKKIN